MFNEILEVLLEAFLDSIKMLPVIVVCYILIELLEEKILSKYKSSKILRGRFAPVFSAGFGLIPQCGFSVVATDLYSKKVITIGSLMAIYLATSDEALPLLLSYPEKYLDMILILAIKFFYAVFVGLLIDAIFTKKNTPFLDEKCAKIEQGENASGCCHHNLCKDKKSFKEIFIHPIIHSLKIFSFILVINIIFGLLIYYVGEENVTSFMLSFGFFQPFLVGLVGMIPNCSASVLITELFISGNITLGSCIAGLSVNAGIALVILFRLNKKLKENILIAISLYALGVLIGVVVNFF